MSYNVTFNVKDKHENPLGADPVVSEFTDAELGAGTLTGVEVKANKLLLSRPEAPVWHEADFQASPNPVDKPTNLAEGDLIIAFIVCRSNVTPSPPEGFAVIRDEAGGGSFVPRIVSMYKIATNNEPETYDFGTGRIVIGRITNHSGVGENTGANNGTGSDTSVDIPAIENVVSKSLLLMGSNARYSTTSITVPTGSTEIYTETNNEYFHHSTAFENIEPTSSTGTRAFVYDPSNRIATQMVQIVGGFEQSGFRISEPTDLSAFGITEPDLRIKWRETVPADTTLTVETAITDSDTVNPDEGDWVEQANGELISNLPADLTGKYLYTRVKMTSDGVATPELDWISIFEDDGTPYAFCYIEFDERFKVVPSTGEAVFEGVAAGEDQPYNIYTFNLNTPYDYNYETEGTVTVVDQNVTENAEVGMATIYTTSVGTQIDIDQPPEDLPGRMTSVGTQVDIYQPPEDPPGRMTSVGTQVEVGPVVTTFPAEDITYNSARLRGELHSMRSKATVDVLFEYSTDDGPWVRTPAVERSAIGVFDQVVSDLVPNRPFKFRAIVDVPDEGEYSSPEEGEDVTEPAIRDITFTVKDSESHLIGGDVFYEEYAQADFEKGELDGVGAAEEGLGILSETLDDIFNTDSKSGLDRNSITQVLEVKQNYVLNGVYYKNVVDGEHTLKIRESFSGEDIYSQTEMTSGGDGVWFLFGLTEFVELESGKSYFFRIERPASEVYRYPATGDYFYDGNVWEGKGLYFESSFTGATAAFGLALFLEFNKKGQRTSLPQDLTPLSIDPGLRAGWQADEPAGTSVTVETAVTGEEEVLEPVYEQQAFITDGTFTVPEGIEEVDVLVVGGGGGGGSRQGGGGGAGGLVFEENFSVTPEADITVTVGGGGNGGTSGGQGTNGGNSIFGMLEAVGGGAGGGRSSGNTGNNGGSGGGGANSASGGTGEVGQGNDGGRGSPDATNKGGGGGGAGQNGGDGVGSEDDGNPAGDGGGGLDYSDKFGTNVGESGWFAGGGGGGAWVDPPGDGGSGGGGDGAKGSPSSGSPQAGIANTGGGGGGSGETGVAGGAGGSGVVIVRWITGYNPTGVYTPIDPAETAEVQTLYLGGATGGTYDLGIAGDMKTLHHDSHEEEEIYQTEIEFDDLATSFATTSDLVCEVDTTEKQVEDASIKIRTAGNNNDGHGEVVISDVDLTLVDKFTFWVKGYQWRTGFGFPSVYAGNSKVWSWEESDSDTSLDWYKVEVNVSGYAGKHDIKFRFTDPGGTGWNDRIVWYDDIQIVASMENFTALLEDIYGEGRVTVEADTDFTITFSAVVRDSGLQADFTGLDNATDPALTKTIAYSAGDWQEQSYGAIITNLPTGSPTGKHLWIRQTLHTNNSEVSPALKHFVVHEGHFAVARVHIDDMGAQMTNSNGETVFENLPTGEYNYTVYGVSTYPVAMADNPTPEESGTATIVGDDIQEDVQFSVILWEEILSDKYISTIAFPAKSRRFPVKYGGGRLPMRPSGLNKIIPLPPAEAMFEEFYLTWEHNWENINLAEDIYGTINHELGEIDVWVPSDSDLTAVVPSWTVPEDYVVTVRGDIVTSGVSSFDFEGSGGIETFVVHEYVGSNNYKSYDVYIPAR